MITHKKTLTMLLAISLLFIPYDLVSSKKSINTDNSPVIKLQPGEPLEPLLNQNAYVILEFYAPFCPTCRTIKKKVAQLAHEMRNKAFFLAVNGDSHGGLRAFYRIKQYPTFVIFKDGRPVSNIPFSNMFTLKCKIDAAYNQR